MYEIENFSNWRIATQPWVNISLKKRKQRGEKKKRSCLLTLNLSISLISDITHQEEILDLITQQLKRPHELLTNA